MLNNALTSKYVYLFELDSVRNTDDEIRIGQQALYDEIVFNGHTVVLTYNQLVDSRGFFSLFENEDYYESIIALFEKGAIRISQYEDIRSIGQYLLRSFEYEKKFIYSGWPLKSTQKRLLALIKRSLTYADLSELSNYDNGGRTPEELSELFVEVDDDNNVHGSSLSSEVQKQIIHKLYFFIKTVLRVSAINTIYLPPRNPVEYKDLDFPFILKRAMEIDVADYDKRELWEEAISVIINLNTYNKKSRERLFRSPYVRELFFNYRNSGENSDAYAFAEAIIDLAYNYTCEISICNISKHYDVEELAEGGDMPTFSADFLGRLDQYWDIGDVENRFLQEESSEFTPYPTKGSNKSMPDFREAVRFIEYSKDDALGDDGDIARYEYDLNAQQKNRRTMLSRRIAKEMVFVFICVLLAWLIDFMISGVEDSLSGFAHINGIVWSILGTFLFLVLAEGITTWLSKHTSFLPLSEALGSFWELIKDLTHIKHKKSSSYFNNSEEGTEKTEKHNTSNTIDLVKTEAIRKYIGMERYAESDGVYRALFNESQNYPIADVVNEPEKTVNLRELTRLEELYNYRFGVVYESRYNRLIVDPIKGKDVDENILFPYERVIPAEQSAVVIVTKYKGKFVMIKQFRHAPRKVQYCFPRGYGERGVSAKENAIKELREEISASFNKEPVFIGNISQDSGLTSGCAAVFLVEVEGYQDAYDKFNEGIIEIAEMSAGEIDDMIAQNIADQRNDFDDGFTLAAYALYNEYVKIRK